MLQDSQKWIRIQAAKENNLRSLSLAIPKNKWVAITGVSGSGKSSLAFEVVAREAHRRFLESLPSLSRQYLERFARPEVEELSGLSPVITLSQKTMAASPRSTLGTLSGLYDHVRLLFARIGQGPDNLELSRGLFSFNSPHGACPRCKGLGLEERISLGKLIADPQKTLREGALAPSLPNGYIMYSQVTIDVLNRVCEAHGFNVDIPWKDLSEAQQDIILNGSQKIKVPFGKHSLESRLKWTGITAKPREEGYYKGMLPIMSDILRRDRNKNILRYAESVTCPACAGQRLKKEALAVRVQDRSIGEWAAWTLSDLAEFLKKAKWATSEQVLARRILDKMLPQIQMLESLGLGHLSMDRPSGSLGGGESQRLRLVNLITAELSRVHYLFDEPSIGLHPRDKQALITLLRRLVGQGNTVWVVEHDEALIGAADWIVELGPGAGKEGGELLFNGSLVDFLGEAGAKIESPTREILLQETQWQGEDKVREGEGWIRVKAAKARNLKGLSLSLKKAALNVVCGVSGAGKSSLVHQVVEKSLRRQLFPDIKERVEVGTIEGLESFTQCITLDQKPIGRTPRSNPATYTGMADRIRDLFSKTDKARERGFGKSRFSFNTKGGRCEHCQGAGKIQVGMHFLGNVELSCEVCEGRRFNPETLEVYYRGKNIAGVFELSVTEACSFFEGEKSLHTQLQLLRELGLGYLSLGQSSTTLSGGEAQRIRLASELQKPGKGQNLYILDEPTLGLHGRDVNRLLHSLDGLAAKGHTLICIENDPQVMGAADWLLEIGPNSGPDGGTLVFEGLPADFLASQSSLTAETLRNSRHFPVAKTDASLPEKISLRKVSTHLLKNIDVDFPLGKLSVITGLSGSGKSTLAFDTLVAEAQGRFSESMSAYARTFLRQSNPAQLEEAGGLGPVVAVSRRFLSPSRRSTVGTLSGILDHLRLLYSRLSPRQGAVLSAAHFSFNQKAGACPRCDGLGYELSCNPAALLTQPDLPLTAGAFSTNKKARFYGDPHGRYLATLGRIAGVQEWDLEQPYQDLPEEIKEIVLYGTGENVWELSWKFKNRTRSGEQELRTTWPGFCRLIEEEFRLRQHNKNTEALQELLHETPCPACRGKRLNAESLEVQFQGKDLAQICQLSFSQLSDFLQKALKQPENKTEQSILKEMEGSLFRQLSILEQLRLGYLSLDRGAKTLSGGEGQRLRLASQLFADLSGLTYVLDEPSLGLHREDLRPLIEVLQEIVERGNTVIAVEHDLEFIAAADHIVELGPGAGVQGGEIIAEGSPVSLEENGRSLTAENLKQAPIVSPAPLKSKAKTWGVRNVVANNLKGFDLDLICGGIIGVSGPSGSGKSSLVFEVILKSLQTKRALNCDKIWGGDHFSDICFSEQKGLGGGRLSSPATYSGIMDELRKFFAGLPEAKELGLKSSTFSYVHKDGRCPECKGMGEIKTALDFLGDLWQECLSCQGSRFRPESAAVRYRGLSMADLMKMTLAEAAVSFAEVKKVQAKFQPLLDLGLGHLKMGQAAPGISGGEAQRLRLSKALGNKIKGPVLYVFDEPSAGLHPQNTVELIGIFQRLCADGHSVLFTGHNELLLGAANQRIVLGPGAGEKGGQLISVALQD